MKSSRLMWAASGYTCQLLHPQFSVCHQAEQPGQFLTDRFPTYSFQEFSA